MLTVYWFESHPALRFCNGWTWHWSDGLHGCLCNGCTGSPDILVQSWGSKGFKDYYLKKKKKRNPTQNQNSNKRTKTTKNPTNNATKQHRSNIKVLLRLLLCQQVKQSQHTAHPELPGTAGQDLIFSTILQHLVMG